MKPSLRVDPPVPENQGPPDTHTPDDDPQRLAKLSQSLRYHLSQPLRKPVVQQDVQPSGSTVTFIQQGVHNPQQRPQPHQPLPSFPQPSPYQQPTSLRIVPLYQHPPPGAPLLSPGKHSPNQPGQPWQTSASVTVPPGQQSPHASVHVQQLPPLKGPGTKSGPYTGYASKAWLQSEFKQDVEELRVHVDEYASRREQRAFELERSVFKAEIAALQKKLAETEDKVVKLELMMPDENGEFKNLKAELDELEKEADLFSDMYAREAKATKSALEGFKQALADMAHIEADLERIKVIVQQIPEPDPMMMMMQQQQQQYYAPAPEAVPSPRVCCWCIKLKRR